MDRMPVRRKTLEAEPLHNPSRCWSFHTFLYDMTFPWDDAGDRASRVEGQRVRWDENKKEEGMPATQPTSVLSWYLSH